MNAAVAMTLERYLQVRMHLCSCIVVSSRASDLWARPRFLPYAVRPGRGSGELNSHAARRDMAWSCAQRRPPGLSKLRVSAPIDTDRAQPGKIKRLRAAAHTFQPLSTGNEALEGLHEAGQLPLHVLVLLLNGLLLADDNLQVIVRLAALQLEYAGVQPVNLKLRPLPDGALGLAVVCSLALELFGSEVRDAPR
jgi:hypothetical protein